MKPSRVLFLASAVTVAIPLAVAAQGRPPAKAKLSKQAQRGEYLVRITGCHDCHTPLAMGPQGPAPDMAKMLSGHPEGMQLPPPPAASGPWIVSFAATNTAAAGPWGVTYAINLTSDKETGIGNWTEKQFTQAMRTGKHMGQGRPILPPMPWQNVSAMTDEDLKAVFAYLQATPPLKNRVPEPTPPAGGAAGDAATPPDGAKK
jgi:cytochrome c553